jgi:putative FmdB family regulatory protein
MPIYEYECTSCGQHEEVIQKFSDKPLTTCPRCAGKLQKLISQSAFHLKGSGWYVTDYANSKKKTEAASGDSTGAGSDGKKVESSKKNAED